jgi:hypothetical protein
MNMRKAAAGFLLFLLVAVPPAGAQTWAQVAKVSEIKRAVPYTTMVREVPGLTIERYDMAVRMVAKKEMSPALRRKARKVSERINDLKRALERAR